LYLALLLLFTVLLAILTGRVYKNRLFKKVQRESSQKSLVQ
jgi:hypothetical protein